MAQDIEKKIVEFIGKSPLGVTSSEIAKFLGVNRVTLTKYLAIVREKAKIDFKQFGMAKLWYIPVDLSQVGFLKEMMIGVCQNTEAARAKEAVDNVSVDIGKKISNLYKSFNNTPNLTKGQLIDSIIDAMNKLGANFSFMREDQNSIMFRNTKCLFGNGIKDCPVLCMATSGIVGTIAAENLGYSRVELKKTIAKGNCEDIIIIYLKK